MQVAGTAVDLFREWLRSTVHEHEWDCLGEVLHVWLAAGGVRHVNEDFTIFLEMALILAMDPILGLPSGRFVYRTEGQEKQSHLPAVHPATTQSWEWWRWFERDLFEQAVFRYHQPRVESQ